MFKVFIPNRGNDYNLKIFQLCIKHSAVVPRCRPCYAGKSVELSLIYVCLLCICICLWLYVQWPTCAASGHTYATRTRATSATRCTARAPARAAWCRAGTSPTSSTSCATTWPLTCKYTTTPPPRCCLHVYTHMYCVLQVCTKMIQISFPGDHLLTRRTLRQ